MLGMKPAMDPVRRSFRDSRETQGFQSNSDLPHAGRDGNHFFEQADMLDTKVGTAKRMMPQMLHDWRRDDERRRRRGEWLDEQVAIGHRKRHACGIIC